MSETRLGKGLQEGNENKNKMVQGQLFRKNVITLEWSKARVLELSIYFRDGQFFDFVSLNFIKN